jgi:hypothetical protein
MLEQAVIGADFSVERTVNKQQKTCQYLPTVSLIPRNMNTFLLNAAVYK